MCSVKAEGSGISRSAGEDQLAALTGWYIDVLGQLAIGVFVQGHAALGALLAQSSASQISLTILRNAICHTDACAVLCEGGSG